MSLLIMAVIVLILIIAGAAYYIFHHNQEMVELEQTYAIDREQMEDAVNEISLSYEGARIKISHDSLLSFLSMENT